MLLQAAAHRSRCPGMLPDIPALPRTLHLIAASEAVDGGKEVAGEVAPPQFAVGVHGGAVLFLLRKNVQHAAILDLVQSCRVAGTARGQQFGRAQEAPDVVGAERIVLHRAAYRS